VNRVPLLGTTVDALRSAAVVDRAEAAVRSKRGLLIGVVNAGKLVSMRRDAALRAAVDAADIRLADGMAVVWASRLLGCPLPERVAGIDLMHDLLRRADRLRQRVYLLGAKPEVVRRVVERIGEEYPGVELAGFRDGYFSAGQEAEIAEHIATARPDLLLVAMSSPRKELFMARWRARLPAAVLHGVGGAFDVYAGLVRRAPRAWQRLGMEWLYRVMQEPRRLWKRYLVTNSIFAWWLLRAMAARWLWTGPVRNSRRRGGQRLAAEGLAPAERT
jgi:N-acetylglucosaminyldiphosphoundecaprenol N-acetyl-beta-D-mannosaminyltransferase